MSMRKRQRLNIKDVTKDSAVTEKNYVRYGEREKDGVIYGRERERWGDIWKRNVGGGGMCYISHLINWTWSSALCCSECTNNNTKLTYIIQLSYIISNNSALHSSASYINTNRIETLYDKVQTIFK